MLIPKLKYIFIYSCNGKYSDNDLNSIYNIDPSHLCSIIKNKKWLDSGYIPPESRNGRNKYSNENNII